jgi:hypothetical protein
MTDKRLIVGVALLVLALLLSAVAYADGGSEIMPLDPVPECGTNDIKVNATTDEVWSCTDEGTWVHMVPIERYREDRLAAGAVGLALGWVTAILMCMGTLMRRKE